MNDKQKQIEVSVGIQECRECKYKLRCEECVYNEKDISKLIDQARKETAEKILKELLKNTQYTFGINGKPIITLSGDFALNIAKQYGVEIKE